MRTEPFAQTGLAAPPAQMASVFVAAAAAGEEANARPDICEAAGAALAPPSPLAKITSDPALFILKLTRFVKGGLRVIGQLVYAPVIFSNSSGTFEVGPACQWQGDVLTAAELARYRADGAGAGAGASQQNPM